jgi:putative NADH-flavin reductase
MQTIALFGGSGRTGMQIVQQALTQGYTLRVLVRNPSAFPITHSHLTIIKGDATRAEDIKQTLTGAQAVISVMGHSKKSPAFFQTEAMGLIIETMESFGIKRILVLTGSGVIFEGEHEPIDSKLVSKLVRTLDPNRFADGLLQCELLLKSGLDYSIVRAPKLTNGPCWANYRSGKLKIGMFNFISRADVAHFMLKVLSENTYMRQAPFVCY